MLDCSSTRKLIQLAIEEDLPHGDCTSLFTIDAACQGHAEIIAKEPLVTCGVPIISMVFEELHFSIRSEAKASEGEEVKAGAVLATLCGSAQELLSAERIILNFLQRLSGIATGTRLVVRHAGSIKVLDTRKTTPGWRHIEKYAVRVGGGVNHRSSLSDMVLVKNNHIDAHQGDVTATLRQVMRQKPPYLPLEVEVRTQTELEAAIPFSPQIILLDNMDDAAIKECLILLKKKLPGTIVEISGGITKERLSILEKIGVTHVSMGSLTTKAQNVDISMRLCYAKN